MEWFNLYGLIFIILILIPNIIYAFKTKQSSKQSIRKSLLILEQIGRYGCMIFMTFNIPHVCFGYLLGNAKLIYLIVNVLLIAAYYLCWAILRKKESKLKALLLSIIPSVIFLFSGVINISIPLLLCSIIFTFSHVYISYKNAAN